MTAVKYLAITDGTTTVRLDTPTSTMDMRSDVSPTVYSSENIWGSDQLIIEPVRLHSSLASSDAAASALQDFIKLIRKAQNHRRTQWQTSPVYLKFAVNETNYRYAEVYDCPSLQFKDVMTGYMEHGSISDLTLSILREHHWRSAPPGVLPTVLTQTATDGAANPTSVFVSNGQRDRKSVV
jgi:hypothetical protein